MEDEIIAYLYNPTVGKIVTFFIGVALIWILLKVIRKNIFLKSKTTKTYKANKFGVFVGYLLSIIPVNNVLVPN
jgi:hypothetical protein